VKRLLERSREWSVLDKGAKLFAGMDVSELSVRLRCLRNRHLEAGRIPIARRFEELPRILCHESDKLEWELPEPERLTLNEPLTFDEPFLELDGRRGEWLLGRDCFVGDPGSSALALACEGGLFSASTRPSGPSAASLLREPTAKSLAELRALGDPGAEVDFCNSAWPMVGLLLGLDELAHGVVGEVCDFEDRRRLLSISSKTISIKISAGSSMLARLRVSDRSWSARRSQPKN